MKKAITILHEEFHVDFSYRVLQKATPNRYMEQGSPMEYEITDVALYADEALSGEPLTTPDWLRKLVVTYLEESDDVYEDILYDD